MKSSSVVRIGWAGLSMIAIVILVATTRVVDDAAGGTEAAGAAVIGEAGQASSAASSSSASSSASSTPVRRSQPRGPRRSADDVARDLDYDIVYVRQPRFGDEINTRWPEVFHPALIDPGADLMLLHPDGSEELLFEGGVGSVTDPFVTFDGRAVLFSYFHDARPEAINRQRSLPIRGADIFRIDLETRAVTQLTHGEFTPNTGAGRFDETNPVDPGRHHDRLGYGILNLGPAPVAGGKIAFTSNRNGFVPPRGYTNPTLQLFVMDEDGGNVTLIAPMNIGSALHPTPIADGRLVYSSLETQGLRDLRVWGLWAIQPDGRKWAPVVSAFRRGQAFHFMTQLGGGDLVYVDYYNLNNNGFGALHRMPLSPPPGTAAFGDAFASRSEPIAQTNQNGQVLPFRMPFTPFGLRSLSPFTSGADHAAPVGADGRRVGKFTHPSAAPHDDLLTVWTPGPANDLARPTTQPYYDGGIYVVPGGETLGGPADLVLIKNDPAYNEAWPRAVVPWSAIHGQDEPVELPWLPNDGSEHEALPAGTPFGLVGTSSFYKRESFPGQVLGSADTFDGLDAFNAVNGSSNWQVQGADAGRYDDSDIWAVRVVAMEPNTHRSYGPNAGPSGRPRFFSHAMERLRILGEIPLRKWSADGRPVLDPEGNPDTSFLARIPADTPFTFQTLDRDGMVLNMAQTWHQVRPGEVRADCGGCHAHSKKPLAFEATAAARPDYVVVDLAEATPLLSRDASGGPSVRTADASVVNVEFVRDIRPILRRSCVPCHTQTAANPPAGLVLDDLALQGRLPGDYARLANDPEAEWGHRPLTGVWRAGNASRYVRKFQSRRSLLTWKIFGRRLDGWRNEHHPTEAVPGDPSTLPAGAHPRHADLDFTGTMMPPPGSGVPPLSAEEKLTIVRWIDLGCPIDVESDGFGWFLDDLRPTLTVSSPRAGENAAPIEAIRIGVADANSGVDLATLSVVADVAIDGHPAGSELAGLARPTGDGTFAIALTRPIAVADAHVRVTVRDRQGNITRIDRRFSVAGVVATASRRSGPPAAPAGVASLPSARRPSLPGRPVEVRRSAARPSSRRPAAMVTEAAAVAPRVARPDASAEIVARLGRGESVESLTAEFGEEHFWRAVAGGAGARR